MHRSTRCQLSLPRGIREKTLSASTPLFRGTRSQLPCSMRPSQALVVPGDCWDAACAFCSPRETCPADPSVGPGRELVCRTGWQPSRALLAMCCNSSELLADGISANALLCRRLRLCVSGTRFSMLDWVRVTGLSCTKGVWYIYDRDTG